MTQIYPKLIEQNLTFRISGRPTKSSEHHYNQIIKNVFIKKRKQFSALTPKTESTATLKINLATGKEEVLYPHT